MDPMYLADVEAFRGTGPRAEAIAWIDATGVRDMPALGYEMTGKRLSTQGYV